MSRLSATAGARRALGEPVTLDVPGRQATSASRCCKAGELSRRLDQALEQSFPAGDPPSLTEPVGDARDVAGCGCAASEDASPAVVDRAGGCCGAARAAERTGAATR
jgi:hypothetical protein